MISYTKTKKCAYTFAMLTNLIFPAFLMSSQVTVSTRPTKRARVTKRATTRRSLKRGSNIQKSLVSVGRGFPKKLLTTLRYCDRSYLSITTGSTQNWIWKANGLYDPDTTSTGHQPYGYDQYSALYYHYVVKASKFWIKLCVDDYDPGIVPNNSIFAVVNVIPASSDSDTVTTKVEKCGGISKCGWANRSSQALTLTENWSLPKYFGTNLGPSQFQGETSGTDPSELSSYEITLYNASGATVNVNFFVIVEYYVEFIEAKDYGPS